MSNSMEANKGTATRFIEAFNTDDWDTVRQVVAADYVYHHPLGGTVEAGPEGMVNAWAGFKAALPDSWHPIPVMITEGEYLAVLLPTYGHHTAEPMYGVPPTGKWVEYGMVNLVRFEKGKLSEMWFGMDSLVEMQQIGAAPPMPPRLLSEEEKANVALFQETINLTSLEYDNLTAFGNVVLALGPPQHAPDTTTRKVDIFRAAEGSLKLAYSHEFTINPPYGGDRSADTELSRAVVKRFFEDVLVGHNLDVLAEIATPNVLVHPTAMPCEASFHGISGAGAWLGEQWASFPDLTIADSYAIAQGDIVAARWTAKGTSKGGFLMLPPTGETVEYTGVTMFRIEDGKIADIWDTRNTFGIMRQLDPGIGGDEHGH